MRSCPRGRRSSRATRPGSHGPRTPRSRRAESPRGARGRWHRHRVRPCGKNLAAVRLAPPAPYVRGCVAGCARTRRCSASATRMAGAAIRRPLPPPGSAVACARGRRRARRRDVLLRRRHVGRERVTARPSDPPDGRHCRGGKLVAVRLARDADAAEQRLGVAAGDRPKPPVDGCPARHARAVRRDDQHRRREPALDQRRDGLRVALRRPEHPEVVDQVLGACRRGRP